MIDLLMGAQIKLELNIYADKVGDRSHHMEEKERESSCSELKLDFSAVLTLSLARGLKRANAGTLRLVRFAIQVRTRRGVYISSPNPNHSVPCAFLKAKPGPYF